MDAKKKARRDIIWFYRDNLIRSNAEFLELIINKNGLIMDQIAKGKNISNGIKLLREGAYNEYLKDERDFSKALKDEAPGLSGFLETDMYKDIDYLELSEFYYQVSQSITQSRKARAGKILEMIIYEIYDRLGYPYVAQARIAKDELVKSVKVDSLVPSIAAYERNKDDCIIASIKTTFRERARQLVDEKERTGVKEIYILSAETKITVRTVESFKAVGINIVTYEDVAGNEMYKGLDNIMSFETYFNEVVPNIVKLWE